MIFFDFFLFVNAQHRNERSIPNGINSIIDSDESILKHDERQPTLEILETDHDFWDSRESRAKSVSLII